MIKKIFYFSLSLFVFCLIIFGAYNFAFKNNVNNPIADPSKIEEKSDSLFRPLPGEEKIANILNEAILGASISEDGALYYYSLDEETLKKSTLEGRDKTVLMSNLPGEVTRILWSPKHDRALISLKQTSGGTLWYLAGILTKTLVPLKPEMSRLSWDNLGERIFYQYTTQETGQRTLNSARPDGAEWKLITDLGESDFYLSPVPKSSRLSFWNRPNARDASTLETVSTVGENRRRLTSGLYGGDYTWSPNGDILLGSGREQITGAPFSLFRLDERDGSRQSFALPTIIAKTAWSKNNKDLYYALPGGLPETAALPDDYYSKPLYTKDTFWKMDVTTGKKTRIIDLKESAGSFDSTDLILSPNEDALFFTDRVSKKLYRIEL